MVSGPDFLALVSGLLGMVGGAAWGGHYGPVPALAGGVVGFPLCLVAGSLYHYVILDLIGEWAARLVKQGHRLGFAIFTA